MLLIRVSTAGCSLMLLYTIFSTSFSVWSTEENLQCLLTRTDHSDLKQHMRDVAPMVGERFKSEWVKVTKPQWFLFFNIFTLKKWHLVCTFLFLYLLINRRFVHSYGNSYCLQQIHQTLNSGFQRETALRAGKFHKVTIRIANSWFESKMIPSFSTYLSKNSHCCRESASIKKNLKCLSLFFPYRMTV